MVVGRAPSSAASIPFLRFLSSSPTLTLTVTPTFSLLKTPTPSARPFFSRSHRFFPVAHTPIAAPDYISGCFPNSIRIRVSAMSTGAGLVELPLSPTSSLKIQKGDITQWSVDGSSDAIVNAANERMLGGGGVDGAIHRAAGPELKEACAKVPEVRPGVRCPTGEARITSGFRLPVAHVIHTVGPIYDVDKSPEESLRNAYQNSLRLGKENNIQYIAFPAISCGVFRYPYDEAAKVAISTVKEFANDFKEPLYFFALGQGSSVGLVGGAGGAYAGVHMNPSRKAYLFTVEIPNKIHFVLFSYDIYNVWLEKAKEIIQK